MGEQIAWNTNFEDVKERDQFPNDNQELNANLMGDTNHHNAHVFAQSDAKNNFQNIIRPVKQENLVFHHQILQPVPQQDLKFSSSENESEEENSDDQKYKKINKKYQKIPSHAAYKKYSRITPQIKEQLINLIARQNMSIKDASIKLKINYSSAKFIFSRYRDRKLQIIDQQVQKDQALKEFAFLRKMQDFQESQERKDRSSKIVVKCSSGGKFEASTEKIFNLREIYELYFEPNNNGCINKHQYDSD